MPAIDALVPCETCRKPFARTHGRQRHCVDCRPCGVCRRAPGSHSETCPHGGGTPRPRATKKPPTNGHAATRAEVRATFLASEATAARDLLRTRLTEEIAELQAEQRALERLLTRIA